MGKLLAMVAMVSIPALAAAADQPAPKPATKRVCTVAAGDSTLGSRLSPKKRTCRSVPVDQPKGDAATSDKPAGNDAG